MNSLYSLSVGRADCHVLLLDEAGQQRCILIDAGWYPPADTPALLPFLRRHGVCKIDLIILTHLHMDHLACLPSLINELPVKRLIAPSKQRIPVTPKICDTQPGNKYLLNLMAYDQFFCWCQRTGTLIESACDYAGGPGLTFGDAALRCLYPSHEFLLPSVNAALKMCDPGLTMDVSIAFENLSRRSANSDSSVWLLTVKGQQEVLFMGDAPMGVLRALPEYPLLRPRLIKLPHHGLGRGYFSLEELLPLHPNHLLVCADRSMPDTAQSECRTLADACGASLHFTFEGDYHYIF